MSKFENNPSNVLVKGNLFKKDLVGRIPNLFPLNVTTGTDALGTTEGFTAQNGATISSSTDWRIRGNKSLKIVTPGTRTFEGIYIRVPVEAGKYYTVKSDVKGTLTDGRFILRFMDGSTLLAINYFLPHPNLDNEVKRFTVSGLAPETTTTAELQICTSWFTPEATTFYIDDLNCIEGELPVDYMTDVSNNDVLTGSISKMIQRRASTYFNKTLVDIDGFSSETFRLRSV